MISEYRLMRNVEDRETRKGKLKRQLKLLNFFEKQKNVVNKKKLKLRNGLNSSLSRNKVKLKKIMKKTS